MEQRYDQSNFSLGELDDHVQARSDWDGYYKGLKFARNVLILPQGGATNRWGTLYVDTLSIVNPSIPAYCQISNYILNDATVYVLVWEAQSIKIYLENILVATVTTAFAQEDIPTIRDYQLSEVVVITWGRGRPYQLVLSNNSPDAITGQSGNTLTLTTALPTIGAIYPVTFTTTGSLPTTNPQIYANVTYYVKVITNNSVAIFSTADDAFNGTNQYTISSAGASSNLVIQNTWTLSTITFDNTPAFDFNHNYDAITFTPSATSGTSVTITLSAPLATLTSQFVGGLFAGNGGALRITSVTDTSHFVGYTIEDFNNTNAIEGTLAILAEPAWSDVRGWPALVSAYQNRLVFGRTPSLPNGRWLSVVNSFYNFDDSETLDDNAISWYPQGAGIGYIQALTSARTLVVHTNTNTQSTPVLNEVPITPTNANFPEQSKFGALPIQPIYLDNQIIFVDKGNNVINMIWEITQSAFVTKNISIPSSGLIRLPVDMAAFAQPIATDGFYALFVNSDGTLANFQSLLEENIRAWSLMNTKGQTPIDQANNGQDVEHNFVHVTTALDRCWFLVQRFIPTAGTPTAITSFNAANNTLFAMGHGLPIGEPAQVTFTTTGVLPTTNPALFTTSYYFAVALDADNFQVYTTLIDAENLTNVVIISNAGTSSSVVYWPLAPYIYLEELDFDVFTDCTFTYNFGSPSSNASGLLPLNGSVVQMVGDDYVLNSQTVVNGQISLSLPVSKLAVGLQYIPKITPLNIAIPGFMGALYNPQHIRTLYIAYVNSIGMQVEGSSIPVITMQQFTVGQPIIPQTGVWQYTPMDGWQSQEFQIDITQPYPLPMTIIGLSYKLEAV